MVWLWNFLFLPLIAKVVVKNENKKYNIEQQNIMVVLRQQNERNYFVSLVSGVRNYLKEALVNIIAVHAEVRRNFRSFHAQIQMISVYFCW